MSDITILMDCANVTTLRGVRCPSKPTVETILSSQIVKASDAIASTVGSSSVDELRYRLYDGWFNEKGFGTNIYELVKRICRDNYPYRTKHIRVFAEVAQTLAASPDEKIVNTVRTERGLSQVNVHFGDIPQTQCGRPECTADTLRAWLLKKTCPIRKHDYLGRRNTCSLSADEFCWTVHQKLVDTSIVADCLFYAITGLPVAIFSNDEDMIPGLVTAANVGNEAVLWITDSVYPRIYYRQLLEKTGVVHVCAY